MAGERTTIARPYAEAVFRRAEETGQIDAWSDMLAFLAATVEDERLGAAIGSPKLDRAMLEGLLLEISEGRLSDEGRNLLHVLVENDRLAVIPEISILYEQLKRESQGTLEVHITSAYAVSAAQQKLLAEHLTRYLGRDVTITSEKDPDLIAGVRIRAGDLVIDGSFQGQLQKLASELGI